MLQKGVETKPGTYEFDQENVATQEHSCLGVPSPIIEPLRDQSAALTPPVGLSPAPDPRPDHLRKLIQVLVLGTSYVKIADSTCSATTLRTRWDESIDAGTFNRLEQICLSIYDRPVGPDLKSLSVDGCIL